MKSSFSVTSNERSSHSHSILSEISVHVSAMIASGHYWGYLAAVWVGWNQCEIVGIIHVGAGQSIIAKSFLHKSLLNSLIIE